MTILRIAIARWLLFAHDLVRKPLHIPDQVRDRHFRHRAPESRWEDDMRAIVAGAVAVLIAGSAFAATKLTPKEIQTEFFDGKSFTAATTSGVKFKLTFTADGKVTREPQDKSGAKGEGTWKLSKEGFCTSWKGSAQNCYTLVNIEKNKWSVVKGAATVATWSK